jgi:hypothetical protein
MILQHHKLANLPAIEDIQGMHWCCDQAPEGQNHMSSNKVQVLNMHMLQACPAAESHPISWAMRPMA